MKFSTAIGPFAALLLASQPVFSQETLPVPRGLDAASPAPVAPIPAPTVVPVPRAIAPDPELTAASFTPGKSATYAQVYVKGPYLAMTFDDGPSAEYTATLLDELKKRDIKATFFLVGENVVEHPALVKRMIAEGHEVGNHSWSHPAFAKMSEAAVTNEIQKTQDAIVAACGFKPTLLRPPYGSITQAQKKWIPAQFDVQIILWSVDPLDWKRPGESVVRSRIVSGASDGAIILAHDIHGGTVHAMPETLDELIGKGFKFATVSELLNMEMPKPSPTPHVLAKAAAPPKAESQAKIP